MDSTPKKILVLRFSSIGDIVLTSPVIRNLRKNFPEAEIHYCTKIGYKGLLEENPYIDRIHVLEDSLMALISRLKKEKFDYIIDLHRNLKTRLIKLALKTPSKAFDKINFRKFLFVKLKINRLPAIHIVDRYMATLQQWGIQNDNEGLDYFIPDKDEVERGWLPESHRSGYYAFAIGGQHFTKKLPVERMIELCDRINKPIVLLGGKEDIEAANAIEAFFTPKESNFEELEVQKKLNKKAVIFNGVGKFNLNQSASLLQQSKAVFTHDTGLMHIAAAFEKEVFSIWGNTSPFFGMYPYQTKFTIFENNEIDCRPCSKIGYSKCPKGHFKCMKDVQFDFYLPD